MEDQHQDRPSGKAPETPDRDDVVRLPVPEGDLSGQLEAMPAPKRAERLQPNLEIDLIEEDTEEPTELTASDLGMPWEEEESSSRTQTPVGWLILIALILIGVGGWAVGRLTKGKERLDEEVERVRETWDDEQREHESALELLNRVENLTKNYLLAGSIEEKLAYVRHAERVRPLMQDYYERHNFETAKYERITELNPVGLANRSFFMVAARVEGGSRLLFVEQTPEGELKFDWESEVAYSPMEIEEFIEKKPTEAMDFRVYARLDNFYSYEFTDKGRYRALMLTFRDSTEFLFGYIKVGTEDERALADYLSPELAKRKPVLLRLRFLPGTLATRSVLVEKFVAPRWVYVHDPESGE